MPPFLEQEIKAELDKAEKQAPNMINRAIEDPESEAAKIVVRVIFFMHEQYMIDLTNKKSRTPKRQRYKWPEKVFILDKDAFERSAGRCMDFAWYAYNWLLPHLYPCY